MGHFFMRMAFYFTARAFHHMDGIGGAGIEQDHTEFIAAQSAQNISMPDRSLHIFRKGDKSPVPRAMSQLVVKRLEIVDVGDRSEEHTSELQSLMRISYAVFCLKKKNKKILTNKNKFATSHKQKRHYTT